MRLSSSQGAPSLSGQRRRRSAHLRLDRSGVGGFFEEIPAFLVIVIAVGMFITTTYSGYLTYARGSELDSLHEDCYRLSRAIRTYDGIVEKGRIDQEPHAGHLDALKLDRLDLSLLKQDLNAPHPFNITIKDRVTGRSWAAGESPPPATTTRAVISSAVLVVGPDGRKDPGSLTVVMWE